MQAQFFINGGQQAIMRMPFTEFMPSKSDTIEVAMEDGVNVFVVIEKTWTFQKTPDGGVTAAVRYDLGHIVKYEPTPPVAKSEDAVYVEPKDTHES